MAIADAFDRFVRDVFSRIEQLVREFDDLARIRDTLLPRLISCKLRIPDAESQKEEAAA